MARAPLGPRATVLSHPDFSTGLFVKCPAQCGSLLAPQVDRSARTSLVSEPGLAVSRSTACQEAGLWTSAHIDRTCSKPKVRGGARCRRCEYRCDAGGRSGCWRPPSAQGDRSQLVFHDDLWPALFADDDRAVTQGGVCRLPGGAVGGSVKTAATAESLGVEQFVEVGRWCRR